MKRNIPKTLSALIFVMAFLFVNTAPVSAYTPGRGSFAPATGDPFDFMLWIVLGAGAALTLIIAIIAKIISKKKDKDDK